MDSRLMEGTDPRATERVYPKRKTGVFRLDVGCGEKWCGDVNVDLYVNPTIHDASRQHLSVHNIPNFVCADAEHLPFKSKAFHEVACFHLLEHVKCPFIVLKEIHRVLKAKGTFIVEVPNANDLVERNHEAHICTWNKYTLRNLLREAGFTVETSMVYGTTLFPFAKRYAPVITRVLTYLFPSKPPINIRMIAHKTLFFF